MSGLAPERRPDPDLAAWLLPELSSITFDLASCASGLPAPERAKLVAVIQRLDGLMSEARRMGGAAPRPPAGDAAAVPGRSARVREDLGPCPRLVPDP